MATIVSDDFGRANGDTVGGGWSEGGVSAASEQINGSTLRLNADSVVGAERYVYQNPALDNVDRYISASSYIEGGHASTGFTIVISYTDENNWIGIKITIGADPILKAVTDGTPSTLATFAGGPRASSTPQIVEIFYRSFWIYWFVDGVFIGAYYVDSVAPDLGIGLRGIIGSGTNRNRFDNYTAYVVSPLDQQRGDA